MASAEVTKLKEDLRAVTAQLAEVKERAARAEGERDQLEQTVAVLTQALKDARELIANLRLAEELGEARAKLDACLVRATQPQPVLLQRGGGDTRG